MSNLIRTSPDRGPLLKTKQWHDRAPLRSAYHLSMQALPASNKAGHWDKKACRWRKMFLHRSFSEPVDTSCQIHQRNHIQMLAAAELSTKAKIAVFFIFVAMRRYNAQEQRDTKIYEKQEEEEEEEKKACKYRKEIWFVPATGIVEWIVMVVTFPVVVVWRSRASEELIEPLHSHREKMKLLNSLPQNFQNLLKTSCPAKSVLTCLNCNYNDDDDDKTRTPYTVLQFFWNPSSASFKQRPWQKTDRVNSRTKNSSWRITSSSRRKVRKYTQKTYHTFNKSHYLLTRMPEPRRLHITSVIFSSKWKNEFDQFARKESGHTASALICTRELDQKKEEKNYSPSSRSNRSPPATPHAPLRAHTHTETGKRPESSAFDDPFAASARTHTHTHTKALTESRGHFMMATGPLVSTPTNAGPKSQGLGMFTQPGLSWNQS